MRFAPLILAAALLPFPAMAQTLGSPGSSAMSLPRTGGWGGATTPRTEQGTPPRGGYQQEQLGTPPADYGFQFEASKVRRDIKNAQQNGQITRKEARSLRRELGSTRGAAARSAAGGSMSYAASSMSQNRLEMVRSRLVAARTRGMTRSQPR